MMVFGALVFATITQSTATDLKLTWTDCGDASTHAKITGFTPSTLTLGKSTLMVGTGNLDENVEDGATFDLEMTGAIGPLVSCKGDAKVSKTCNLPLGTGSLTFEAMTFPIQKGSTQVKVNMNLGTTIPPPLLSTTTKVTAKATNGDKLFCMQIKSTKALEQDTQNGPAPPAPVPPAPTPVPPDAATGFDCTPFGCTCQGFANWFGTTGNKGARWACATDPAAQSWYNAQSCLGKKKKVTPSVVPGTRRGGCSCINNSTDTAAGLHDKVKCDVLLRGFSVTYNVPQKCLTSSCGLIVDVHGFTMDGDRQNANTNMRALGEENGYIVVQPNAPGHNWNPGVHWVPPFNEESPGDRAINNVVQELAAVTAWKVDRNRIHLTGFSEGGWVTGRMLCTYQHFYKSFVMLAGASNADPLECVQAGSPQPPLLVNQGLNDLSSHWSAWTSSLEKVKGKWKLGEGKVIAGNATCSPGMDEDEGRVGCYTRTRYESPTGTPLEVLSYNYVADYFLKGHCFPGSTDTGKIGAGFAAFACPGAQERKQGFKAAYTIGEEAMKWFMAHEKSLTVIV